MDTRRNEFSKKGEEMGVSPVRRRLIKTGAFVPPVVLTLRSGAVRAQASTASCLAANQEAAQEQQQQDPNFELSPTEDNWLRSRVVIREARRVRKKNGKWLVKGDHVFKIYSHDGRGATAWYGLRPGRLGRRRYFRDSGRFIEVYDSKGETPLLTGVLLFRRGNRLRRYVAIHEYESYGIVATDAQGDPILGEDGRPEIGAVVDNTGTLQSQHVSASCWASLGVSPTVQI
jgi:hypothetical protein